MFRVVELLCTWFGVGLLPRAPGTWGSVAALPFAWAMAYWGGFWLLFGAVIALSVIGWWACAHYVKITGMEDPSEVVVDEVVGQWITLLVVPPDLLYYALGLALFRWFDITKPWPVGAADRDIPGGLGVMADDVLAGLMAAACLYVITWFI